MQYFTPFTIFWLCFMAVFVVIRVRLYTYYNPSGPKDPYVKKRMMKMLDKFCQRTGSCLVDGITVDYKGHPVQLDTVVFTSAGVLYVTLMESVGNYYGQPLQDEWSLVYKDGKREHFANPLKKGARDCEIIRRLCAQEGVIQMEMTQVVIFGGGKSSKLFMPSRLDLLPVSKFESFLKYYTQKSRGILDPQEGMRALRSKEITAAPAEPAQAE